jgi:hypothetical protein
MQTPKPKNRAADLTSTLGQTKLRPKKTSGSRRRTPSRNARPSSAGLQRNLCDSVTCTTYRCASDSLQVRLENPSQTCFHAKQDVRSRQKKTSGSRRQTKTCLVLMPKPKNRRGDFETQITKPELPVLRPKPGNSPPPWF